MMQKKVDCDSIFTVSGDYPQVTYVDRGYLSRQLATSIKNHRLTIISGLSKSGKTLLVRHTLRYVDSPRIWISGSLLRQEESFWITLVKVLNEEMGLDFDIGYERDAIMKVLGDHNYCIIVDDFHYVPDRSIRADLSRLFKTFSEKGITVFVIGVQSPSMRELEEMSDLRARSLIINLNQWSDDDLSRIGQQGFSKCGFGVANIGSIAQECLGSPFMMQRLCQIYCYRRVNSLGEAKPGYIESVSRQELDLILSEAAGSISYMDTYAILTDPETCAIDDLLLRHDSSRYGNLNQLILYALTGRHPFGAMPLFEVHISKLWQRLREVLSSERNDIPTKIIHKSLKLMVDNYFQYYIDQNQMEDVPRFDPVLDLVGQKLYIRDPFLLFHLRHSQNIEAQFGTIEGV